MRIATIAEPHFLDEPLNLAFRRRELSGLVVRNYRGRPHLEIRAGEFLYRVRPSGQMLTPAKLDPCAAEMADEAARPPWKLGG